MREFSGLVNRPEKNVGFQAFAWFAKRKLPDQLEMTMFDFTKDYRDAIITEMVTRDYESLAHDTSDELIDQVTFLARGVWWDAVAIEEEDLFGGVNYGLQFYVSRRYYEWLGERDANTNEAFILASAYTFAVSLFPRQPMGTFRNARVFVDAVQDITKRLETSTINMIDGHLTFVPREAGEYGIDGIAAWTDGWTEIFEAWAVETGRAESREDKAESVAEIMDLLEPVNRDSM